MTYSELVQLYFERSTALQNYWTLYVVIVGGLLAFSSLRKDRGVVTTLLLTVLFGSFAYKNLGAIEESTLQRFAVVELLKQTPADAPEIKATRAALEPTLNPPALGGVRNFHVFSDILTIAALWAMERRRGRSA